MDKTRHLELGQRLKSVRELNGFSQRELARRADMTNSNVSMIEQGLVSPSVSSLTRLLDAIPLSLAQFFACDPERADESIYRAGEHSPRACSRPGIEFETLRAQSGESAFSLTRYRFAPGGDTGPECRRENSSLAGWLLTGEIELSLGARVYHLQAEDGFRLPAGQIYRARNTGSTETLLILAREGSEAG